ncbi:MAG TPA: lysylphosphatidylglycerol synthase transmembrane domain-containing protein [Telluria sp.]
MSARKLLHLVLGIALAAAFLWLVLRQISLGDIRAAFFSASTTLILVAVAAFCAGYACRIERWRRMLAHDNPALRWSDCAGPFMGCVATNNVLPFRAGDVLRAFGFNRRLGTTAAASLATVLVERLLDLLMVTAFLGLALAWFGMSSSRLLGVGGAFLVAGAAVILLVLLFPSLFKPVALAAVRLLSTLAPGAGARVRGQIDRLFGALEYMASGATMPALVVWSALAWMAEGAVFWLCALALPSIAQPLAAWLALPIGTLATVIPSTPGFVGTFDYFVMQAMAAQGNTAASATAYALLVHTVLWLPPTILGGAYLLAHPAKQLEAT